MSPQLLATLNSVDVTKYVVEYRISKNFVSYRYEPDPFGASKRNARYNPDGVNCFYIADSIETAQREVNFSFKDKALYYVNPCSIFAFDAQRFAKDFSFSPMLTGAEKDGGYQFSQDLAEHLVNTQGLSGVAYPSRQMALEGKTGMCIAILPQNSQLDSGKLLIFHKPTV